jgi:hypothetical protein
MLVSADYQTNEEFRRKRRAAHEGNPVDRLGAVAQGRPGQHSRIDLTKTRKPLAPQTKGLARADQGKGTLSPMRRILSGK